MPVIAALTIADGQATPVNHTFAVGTTDGKSALWADKVLGVPSGYPKITHEVREAKSATGAHSVIIGYEFPILGTVDGVTKRVRVSSAQVRLNFAQDSTVAERKDAVAYVINFLSNASVKPSLYDIEPFY